jgi:hypothetical protein
MIAPRPVTWYKWPICVVFGFRWALPAVVAMPRMQLQLVSLASAEILWFALCLLLALTSLSSFRIELSDQGVTKRGVFATVHIAWPEATFKRVGYLIVVSSTKGSVRINPFIYSNPVELDEFLCPRRYMTDKYFSPDEGNEGRPSLLYLMRTDFGVLRSNDC